jgi:serine protease AprX
MKSLQLAFLLAVLFLLPSLQGSPSDLVGVRSVQAAASVSTKIDPAVLAATANGGLTPLLIILAEQADLSAAARLETKDQKGEFVFNALRATADRTQPSLRGALDHQGIPYRSYYIVNSVAVQSGSLELIRQLAARPDVARIESDAAIRIQLPVPLLNTGLLPFTTSNVGWGVDKINAPKVWAMGFRGHGVVYGIADTGVQWNHPALKNHYRGWNGSTVNHNFSWWDAVHQDVSGNGTNICGFSLRTPCDDYGHGTHALGIGVGGDGGKNHIGVAPGAKWIGCRNMEEGVGRPSQYIECFQFFLAPWNLHMKKANPKLAADVISNSWTCPLGAPPSGEDCTPDSLRQAVEVERAAGVFVVASAGNTGPGCSSVAEPPAIYDAATTVGATDMNDYLAGFSSRGPVTLDGSNRIKPDLSAPGVNIRSSYPHNSYAYMSGTSMSAPHVAGAAALLWSANPKLRGRVSRTEQILFNSANPNVVASGDCGGTSLPDIPNNLFGYGRVDVLAAVKRTR